MHTNAAGVIPIVEALMGKGAPLGTVLAFMMLVIALSLPEMIILRQVLALRLIAVFIGAVGERSLKATYFLMYQGYDRVMNMRPGIARWVARGFAITGSAEAAAFSTAASSCCDAAAGAASRQQDS